MHVNRIRYGNFEVTRRSAVFYSDLNFIKLPNDWFVVASRRKIELHLQTSAAIGSKCQRASFLVSPYHTKLLNHLTFTAEWSIIISIRLRDINLIIFLHWVQINILQTWSYLSREINQKTCMSDRMEEAKNDWKDFDFDDCGDWNEMRLISGGCESGAGIVRGFEKTIWSFYCCVALRSSWSLKKLFEFWSLESTLRSNRLNATCSCNQPT